MLFNILYKKEKSVYKQVFPILANLINTIFQKTPLYMLEFNFKISALQLNVERRPPNTQYLHHILCQCHFQTQQFSTLLLMVQVLFKDTTLAIIVLYFACLNFKVKFQHFIVNEFIVIIILTYEHNITRELFCLSNKLLCKTLRYVPNNIR